ncbi:hypothetical protein ABZZ17_24715 [Streptomyces sp. NPDC006512]|uniref:hypothetical protein n=1 Tax=Streptomyces sp. NPDC006512 TaxID=3154307 RepID=UPI0033AF0DD2
MEGQVRGLQVRTDQQGESDRENVWTFRVERYDASGRRVALVPVEMRGRTFEGAIHEGDWVRAHGRMRSGTFRVTRVENRTTGAEVRPKGLPKPVIILVCIFFAIVVAFIAWVAYGMFTMPTGPPPGWDSP